MIKTIAKRILRVEPGNQEVEIALTEPAMEDDGTWRCHVQLSGLAVRQPPPGYGIDGIQAIQLAILNAEAWIRTSPEYKAGKLFHADGSRYMVDPAASSS